MRTLRFPTRALLATSFTLLSASASALLPPDEGADPVQGCSEDVDCGEGGVCEKVRGTSGCEVGPDGDSSHCDTTIFESEYGSCHYPPPPCTEDAECGEYMMCQSGGTDGACWVTSDGETGCEEGDPLPSTCQPEIGRTCASDTDCQRDFECVPAEVVCLDIACEDGNPNCGCSDSDRMECQPKEIACDSNDECPSGWSCAGTVSYECSGGGATEPAQPGGAEPTPDGDSGAGSDDGGEGGGTSVGGGPGDAASPPDEELIQPEEPECRSIPQKGSCIPDDWSEVWGTDLDAENPTSGGSEIDREDDTKAPGDDATPPQGETDADGANSEGTSAEGTSADASGCSVSRGTSGSGSPLWLALLLFVPLLRRRKSATH